MARTKSRSIEDVQMDMDAVKRIMEHLMRDYERFHDEREALMKNVYHFELFQFKGKKALVKK